MLETFGRIAGADLEKNRLTDRNNIAMRTYLLSRQALLNLSLVLLYTLPAFSQQTWARTYGGKKRDVGMAVQQTADGGYIVAGYSCSYGGCKVYLIKTNASGERLWEKTYPIRGMHHVFYVQQSAERGYLIAVRTVGETDAVNYYWIKTDEKGNSLGTKADEELSNDYHKFRRHLYDQKTSDGGHIILDRTTSPCNLIKINTQGDTLWKTMLDRYYPKAVQHTRDGGYIVTGLSPVRKRNTEASSIVAGGRYVLFLSKTDSVGNTLWSRTYGGKRYSSGQCVQQTRDGGYIIVGSTHSSGQGNDDVYLIKTDSLGNVRGGGKPMRR